MKIIDKLKVIAFHDKVSKHLWGWNSFQALKEKRIFGRVKSVSLNHTKKVILYIEHWYNDLFFLAGSFHLLHLMFDDYVLYLVENLHSAERSSELLRTIKGEQITGKGIFLVILKCLK